MPENISHMILHLIPDETFESIKDIEFATPYVQRKALNAIDKSFLP